MVVDLIDVSTRVGWPVYAVLALLCAFLVWVLVAPDFWWRKERALVGWRYRDGHRIELSTAGRLWMRFCALAALVVVIVVTGATVDRTAVSRVETEVEGGKRVYHVGDPVDSPGCTVRIVACLASDTVFPIPVSGYEVRGGDQLLLDVDARHFPTHVVLDEGDTVTVTLYGRCERRTTREPHHDSEAECPRSLPGFGGVVPVRLDRPLDGRAVVDGTRDATLTPST